ncbi:MAG: hypothetical protein JW791_01695 [Nanoarchaeota archaeon]|nr:hypothetical protein [Nanoarchaeota archaeon]
MINNERLGKIRKELKDYLLFELLGKGRRGVVYKISNDLVVKIERDDIKTFNVVKNEYDILKRLGKYSYFPKPVLYNKELRFLIREYVKGEIISKSLTAAAIIDSLKMCYVLDRERINQQELTNPFKHIYVKNGKVMMIDFERARITENAKNVSQFVQYLVKKIKINDLNKVINAVKNYKKTLDKKDFEKLLLLIKSNLVH